MADNRSSREIEREIEAERARLRGTVDALHDRLTFDQYWERAGDYLRSNSGRMSTQVGRAVRDNPVAAIVTGVGLAWLILGSRRDDARALPAPATMPSGALPVATPHIRELRASCETLAAFEITGTVEKHDMHVMAARMNHLFDRHDEVDMLLIFRAYGGSETGASLDWESLKSQFRSLGKVGRYVVVGAPPSADRMLDAMGKIIPVETKHFSAQEEDAAWSYLGASRPEGSQLGGGAGAPAATAPANPAPVGPASV